MEHYKFNMAECCHAGLWQEDILGKTCLDCGFNTYHNDCGMYDNPETKGIVTRINEEMDKERGITINNHFRFKSTEGMPPNVIIIGDDLSNPFEQLRQLMVERGYKPLEFGEKGRWKIPEPDIKPEQVFKIEAPPEIDELVILDDTDPLKLNGTKQKKTRKGNNKKYFRRKRK